MTRIEENEMVLNEIVEEAKRQPTMTYNDTVEFQLTVIATMLADISKSLAVLADKAESENEE